MPHQCTNCGRTFADGSTEMLSGCPDCGGNRFQFTPKGRLGESGDDSDAGGAGAGAGPDDPARRPTDAGPGTDRDGETATSVDREGGAPASKSGPEDAEPAASGPEVERGDEDAAQAEARSEVVPSSELPGPDEGDRSGGEPDDRMPAASDDPPEHGRVVSEPDGTAQPSLEELREELDEQFESIKIVQPGRYELNLMELYDREEYIVSLQEDGRYVIDVPDSWRESDDG